jgi:hypothetical protein
VEAALGGFEVGEVGQRLAHRQPTVAGLRPGGGTWVAGEHLGQGDRVVAGRPQAAGQVEVGFGHLRGEVGPGPVADHGGGRFGAGQAAGNISGERHVQHLGRRRDGFVPPMEGQAAPVVALVLVVHRVLHVRAQPEPDGEAGGDVAMRGHRLMRHRPALGREPGQPGQPRGQGRIQPHLRPGPGEHAARAVQVDQVEIEPGAPGQMGRARCPVVRQTPT